MLRPARPDDVPFIEQVLNLPGNLDKLESYPASTIRDAITGADHMVLIWHPGPAPEGFAWLRRDGRAIKLEEFGMARTGTGAGRLFFTALLDHLRAQGRHDLIWLYVAADNAGAIRFYDRFGFRSGAIRPAVWHRRAGPVADALRMDLSLQPE